MLKKDRKIVIEVEIEQEDNNKLQRAFYELKAFQDTLSYLLDAHSGEEDYINSSQFVAYNNKAIELFKTYDDFKNYITIKYVPKEYLDSNDTAYTWESDFNASKISIFED